MENTMTTAIDKLVAIPEGNVERFEKAMKKLVKVSKKLNSGDVTYSFVGTEVRKHKEGKETIYIQYHNYKISGETPQLNGYSLIAILERQGDLNLVYHVNKDVEMPDGLQEKANYCEHCNSNRRRKYLFILQEEKTGTFIQVGKSCVKDFTGSNKSPDAIAEWYEWIADAEECEVVDMSYGRYTSYVNSIQLIAFSAYFTDTEGYVKTSDGTEENPSTVTKALKYAKYVTEEEVKELGYFEKAQEVAEWYLAQNTKNDYMMNIQTLIKLEAVAHHKAGFLASAYSSYKRAMGNQQEQIRKQEAKKPSEYVGTIGKRSEYILTYDRETGYSTDWGYTSIYFFHDDNDNVYLWKTTSSYNFEKGERVKMKATLKDHNEYNGTKQNVLTRCNNIETI